MSKPELSNLPQSGREDELEALSFSAFQSECPVSLFIFRDERGGTDKGVDATIELKKERRATNFRACLQFKGTDSTTLNSDGSFSKSVEVQNLNYLLNGHCPIYTLFIAPQKELRYLWAEDYARTLNESNPDWREQSTVALRFSQVLDRATFNKIHQRILEESVRLYQFRDPNGEHLIIEGFSTESRHVKQHSTISQLLAATEADPLNAEKWVDLAAACYTASEFKNAYYAINKAWSIGTHDLDMRAMKACILAEYARAHKGPKSLILEAISLFESLREFDNDSGSTDYDIGNCYQYLGDDENAVSHFNLALASHPSKKSAARILTNLGHSYDSLGEIDKAVECFKNALKHVPTKWQALASWASIESNGDNYKKAASLLEKCLVVKPDLERTGVRQLSVLAKCLFYLGRYEEAYHRANQSLAIEPEDEFARNAKLNILAKLWRENSDYTETAKEFLKSEIANCFQVNAVRGELLSIYLTNEEWAKAKNLLEDMIKEEPPVKAVHFNYAFLLEKEGDLEGAIAHLKAEFEINPQHYVCHKLAILLDGQKKYEEAASFYALAVSGMRHPIQMLNDASYCFAQAGNHTEAVRYAAKAILYTPRESQLWRNLIASYLKLGKREHFDDLDDLRYQVADTKGRVRHGLELLVSILEEEFGREFAQSVTSCELGQAS